MSDPQQVEGRFSRAARYLLLHYRGCVWYSTVCMVRKLEDMDYHSRPGYCGTCIGTPPCMRGSSAGGDYHMGWEVWKQARGRGRGRPGCGSSMHLHITAQRTLLPAYVCMYVYTVPTSHMRSLSRGAGASDSVPAAGCGWGEGTCFRYVYLHSMSWRLSIIRS
jgi:hypothetical protein